MTATGSVPIRGQDARHTDSAIGCQIPPQPALPRGMESDIYICYTRKLVRRGAPIDLALQEMQLGDILTAGTAIANNRQIFHQAVLSFAVIVFGTRHGQTLIINQGYAIHGAALKQLNNALQDSKCYTRDEVILSVATLAILECHVPTGPKHYLMHMAGLERLLELRSQSSFFTNPKSFELYKAVRHMILFASLRTGKRSILAREEWKMVFRENCSNEEEIQEQDLYDVLADCTVLAAEQHDGMMSANLERDPENRSSHQHPQNETINRKALSLLNHLRIWRKRWDSDERNSYFEAPVGFATVEPVQQEPLGDDLPPFLTTSFEFSSNTTGIMLMFYNTTLTYIFRVLASVTLENIGTQSGQSFRMQTAFQDDAGHLDYDEVCKQTTKQGCVAVERLAALEVCRCIPDYLKRKSGLDSDSSPVFQWAVATAWVTLRGNENSAEGKWMMKLFNTKYREFMATGLLTG